MNKQYIYFFLVYFVLISLVTVAVTLIDKSRAKHGGWRTPEKTLILLAFFGGAISEYITMKLIHHKTLHKKFMIGLPAIIVFHMVLIAVAVYFVGVRA